MLNADIYRDKVAILGLFRGTRIMKSLKQNKNNDKLLCIFVHEEYCAVADVKNHEIRLEYQRS